jgi:N6-adenosine-specific RNA methylase IME4
VPVTDLSEVPKAIAAIDRLEAQIRGAKTLAELNDYANQAAGLQRRYKPVKQVADRAGLAWIAAMDKLADELTAVGTAKGTRGQFLGGSNKAPPRTKPKDPTPTLAELKVTKKVAACAKRVKAIPPEARKVYYKELQTEDKAVNPNALLQKQRQHAKQEKKHDLSSAVFSADGPFDCVVIDPPWPMQKIDRDVRPNQDAFDYPVMTEAEIAAFWADNLAERINLDCHLFMWTTQRWLPAGFRLLEQFGFRYVFVMVWHKPGGFQPIDLPQYNCEFVIYGRRGNPVFIDTRNFATCFEAPRREHSRKPEQFYETIARVTGGSRIDVFAREQRIGFAQFGNEVDKFAGAA